MDYKDINQKLKNLENHVYDTLSLVSEFSFDQTIDKSDFSKEFLYFELFYSFSNYERAVKAVDLNKKLDSRLKTVYDLSMETLALEGEDYFERLQEYSKEYFSSLRYKDQINTFKETINFDSLNDLPDDSRTILEDKLYALFKIRDEINQLNDKNSLFVKYAKLSRQFNNADLNIYLQLKNDISVIHDDNKNLWSAFYDVIDRNRSVLLIPNNIIESKWWYNIELLSAENIETALYSNYDLQSNKELVKDTLSKIMPNFEKQKETVNDSVEWIVDNHVKTFDHILNLSKSPTPAFQAWSSETTEPTRSDHAVSGQIFRNIPNINKEIIRDLINVVQFDEEIDDEKRDNVLATAYLILGEIDKALEILNEK